MKTFTAHVLDRICSSLLLIKGMRRIRRGLLVGREEGGLVFALSFQPREWPDNVVSISVYAQIIWEKVEETLCKVYGLRHARFSLPSFSSFADFDPPLSFLETEYVEGEIDRISAWFRQEGREFLETRMQRSFLLNEQLLALEGDQTPPNPERAFLMMIEFGEDPTSAYQQIYPRLNGGVFQERLSSFYEKYTALVANNRP